MYRPVFIHDKYIFFFQDLLDRKIALYLNRHIFSSPFCVSFCDIHISLFYNQQSIPASPRLLLHRCSLTRSIPLLPPYIKGAKGRRIFPRALVPSVSFL